jgi:glycosyltransferase involved in cell wall biosynthesis
LGGVTVNICIDLSAAVHHRAGIGRYAQELTSALVALDRGHTYTAFYNRPADAKPDSPLDRLARITVPWDDKPWRLRTMLAHVARHPQDRLFPGVDLFHATDHLLPCLGRVPSVFTLYDLTYLLTDTHSSLNRLFLTLMVPRFLNAADGVITISESARSDLLRNYAIEAEKVRVIYGGVSPDFRAAMPDEQARVRAKYGLPHHYMLTVGTIEPRKNLSLLLEAYRSLPDRRRDIYLVIVGRRGWRSEEFFARLHQLRLEQRVVLLHSVPDADLPALYSMAELFVFPSLYEGFGLPPLEAMACGTPVVASNTSSLPEVVGDAGIRVDPHDVAALAEAMEAVLTNPDLAQRLAASGAERAARFTWQAAALATEQVYADVLGVPNGRAQSPARAQVEGIDLPV